MGREGRASHTLAAIGLSALLVGASQGPRGERWSTLENPEYTGRFVFTRIRYGSNRFEGRGRSRWSHDYPRADRYFSRLLGELTTMQVEIDVTHPIFHVFFDMESIDFPHPLVNVMPSYFGLFENADPRSRMLGIINYNNDIAEYWEWSDTGWLPIDFTNEAYKLGVNYVVYAMTH